MTPDAIVIVLLAAATTTAAAIDLRTRRVPNELTVSLAIVGVGLAVLGLGRVSVAAAFAGCGVGLLVMLPLHAIGAMGAGDVKLFAAAGTLLGPAVAFQAFLYTAIAGGVIALAIALHRGALRHTLVHTVGLAGANGAARAAVHDGAANNRFAYASAIAVGTLLAAWVA